MVLNYIWVAFFVIAFIVALCKLIFMGDVEIFTELVNSTFSSSKTAFEISLGLTGILALWLGVMKIGENSGMINALSRWLSPVFCRLFPEIPKGHPAMGSIFMNLSANMLGLDNAATPMGLKAMKELQELNPKKDTATNPMVMFLVLNTSGLILIPVSIMMYRSQMGAAQPTDIFIPTLITTAISTIVGVIAVSIAQRINLLNKPILILIGCISLFFAALIYLFTQISRDEMGVYSTLIANILLFSIILLFILWGLWKKINVYDAFIEGAKEGFTTAVRIIPYPRQHHDVPLADGCRTAHGHLYPHTDNDRHLDHCRCHCRQHCTTHQPVEQAHTYPDWLHQSFLCRTHLSVHTD